MIGQIKEVEIHDKKYELIKRGVNTALTVQSIFLELISKASINLDKDISENDLEVGLLIAMRGKVLDDIKEIIIDCVSAPKFTSDSYDSLEPEKVTQLFMAIYYFHLDKSDKKKVEQPTS